MAPTAPGSRTAESGTGIVIPDAGPLITLAYADALELLHAVKDEVWIIDMIAHELTRRDTPTSERIARWIATRCDRVIDTAVFAHHRTASATGEPQPRTANLGELAAQEAMNALAMATRPRKAVFLFEDHKLARTGFVLPDNCTKVTTRSWLRYLERTGRIESARAVEHSAIENGRAFSRLRFPPDDAVREPAAGYSPGNGPVGGTFPLQPSKAARRGPNAAEILRLRITLDNVIPTVSRTVLVRASSPLSTLHGVIQMAMGWQECHLHEFEKDGRRYAPEWCRAEDPELVPNGERKRVGTLFGSGSDTLQYVYDFGDWWRHTIKLEARLPPNPSLHRPCCIEGRNACPPEDVGGPPGYARFLDVIADPNDDEHEHLLGWAGGAFNPEQFDLDDAEQRLAAWFPVKRRPVASAR